MRSGVLFALAAYTLWGLLPLYLKLLRRVAPHEILLHRMVWSAVFLALVLSFRRQWAPLVAALRDRRTMRGSLASATLLAVNWFVFIWAVGAGRIVDASLGYFVNPLFSVLLGVLLLDEKLRPGQWFALAIAASGVVWLTVQANSLPWIALVLAASFGLYGFFRKTGALGALDGLALETFMLLPIALLGLVWQVARGQSGIAEGGPLLGVLLLLSGPLTAVPLLLFAAGARRIPLSLLGLLQYVGPTIQLFIGLFVFRESFDSAKLVGYGLIWLALVVYSADGWRVAVAAGRRGHPGNARGGE